MFRVIGVILAMDDQLEDFFSEINEVESTVNVSSTEETASKVSEGENGEPATKRQRVIGTVSSSDRPSEQTPSSTPNSTPNSTPSAPSVGRRPALQTVGTISRAPTSLAEQQQKHSEMEAKLKNELAALKANLQMTTEV